MTCDAVLVGMLHADLDELKGRASTALASHVRGCRKCAAVADRLVTGTRSLARAAAHKSAFDFDVVRDRPSRRLVVGAGVASLAASIVVSLLVNAALTTQFEFTPRLHSVITLPRTPAELASERIGMIEGRIAAPRDGRLTALNPVAPLPVVALAFVPVAPVAPVAVAPVELPELSLAPFAFAPDGPAPAMLAAPAGPPFADAAGVSLDPLPGVHAAILGSRNPAITVVWIH